MHSVCNAKRGVPTRLSVELSNLPWKDTKHNLLIAGCTTEDGVDMEVGTDRVVNNSQVQRCLRFGRQVTYHSYPCGFNGRSCEVKPLEETVSGYNSAFV